MLSCTRICDSGCYDGSLNKLEDLLAAGSNARRLAGETVDICDQTRTKGNVLIEYAQDVQNTFQGFGNKMNPSTFMKIKDLLDRDRIQESTKIANEMDDLAVACGQKSKEINTEMERGLESIPGTSGK